MAASIVQSASAYGVGATADLDITFSSDVTDGNLVVVCIYIYDEDKVGASEVSATQCGSATYITGTLDDDGMSNYTRSFWLEVTSTGSCTITLDPATSEYLAAVAWELTGVETTSPIEDASVAAEDSGTSTAVDSGNVTISQNCVLLGCMTQGSAYADPGPTLTPGTNYTQDEEHEASSNNFPYNGCHRTTVPIGSGTYSVDWTIGSAQRWLATAIAVKEASGGGGTVPVLAHHYRQMQGVG